MSLQISNIHKIIIVNKIQLRKKIHSDFVCVDLRNNASFINIESAHFFYINIISAHVIYYFF